jgi:hypothetical protein
MVGFVIWSVIYVDNETNKDQTCYYELCSDYADAIREGNLCHCYDYDLLGQLQLVKTEIMK